jgi:hypothetical protein
MSNTLSIFASSTDGMVEVWKPQSPLNKHETSDRGKRYTVMNTKKYYPAHRGVYLTVIVSI